MHLSPLTVVFIVLFSVCMRSISLNAQLCIEYPELEGEVCDQCPPDGWIQFSGTTSDIIDDGPTHPGGNCDMLELSGLSPGGGNMVLLLSLPGGNYMEGIETSIDGLNPDIQYSFGLWWEMMAAIDCNSGDFIDGDLLIIIDGEEYSYSGAEDWELVEICVQPSSSSIDISIQIYDQGQGAIVVDSPSCDMLTPCCSIDIDFPDEEYDYCPGETLQLESSFTGHLGNASYEWTCSPFYGVTFLSDRNSLTPELYIDIADFDGETFVYSLVVEDEICVHEESIVVNATPSLAPEFEIYICELYEDYELPQVSLYGFTGIWEGDFDFEDLAGTTQEYIFELDPGQENCIESWTYQFEIHQADSVSFDLNQIYCINDSKTYRLPDSSNEKIDGNWDENRFSPDDLGIGIHQFVFVADQDMFCTDPYILEIEIQEPVSPEFNLLNSFCSDRDSFYLPIMSIDSVMGNWNQEFIDLNSTVESDTLYFTPEIIDSCYGEYMYVYSITEKIEISFSTSDTLCRDLEFIQLDSMSNEGYTGSWHPQSILFDTITSDSFMMVWSPLPGQIDCLQDTLLTFHLTELSNPEFNIPLEFCQESEPFILPAQSLNGIDGEWSLLEIDPEILSPGQHDLLFSPNNTSCIMDYEWTITIVPPSTPEFDLPNSLCDETGEFIFPQQSINNIPGVWDIETLDLNSFDHDTVVLNTFSPDANVCSIEIIDSIRIIAFHNIDILSQDPTDCGSNDGSIQLSGIGSEYEYSISSIQEWTQNSSISDLDQGIYELLIRSLADTNCIQTFFIELEGDEPIEILDIQIEDITGCSNDNGSILIQTNSLDHEFSIDNGNSWQTDNLFQNLAAGDYILMIRIESNVDCIEERNFEIQAYPETIINDLSIVDISDCELADGTITVDAEGMALEYSIDNGSSWQDSNQFNNLAQGTYTILVRSASAHDCEDEIIADIFGPEIPQLVNVDYTDISDCGNSDAEIYLYTTASDPEFSIDNGQTWQSSNGFQNLGPGDYTIIIREQGYIYCLIEYSFTIDELDAPIIVSSHVEQPSQCFESDAFVEIVVDINDAEFSIDNGASWQSSNLFNALDEAAYTILIRSRSKPNCSSEFQFAIEYPECPCNELNYTFETIDVSCSQPNSGSILISELTGTLIEDSYEISWMNGISGALNSQLSEGWYYIEISYDKNCLLIDSVYLESTEDISFDLLAIDQTCSELGSIEVLNASGGSGQYSYSIDALDYQTENIFEDLNSQVYTIVVKDDAGCETQTSVPVEQIYDLYLELPPDLSINLGSSVLIEPEISGSPIDSFVWMPAEGILNQGELIANVSPSQSITYSLTIYYGDCVEERSINIEVISSSDIYIANIFSPDGDGNNDTFFIQSNNDQELLISEFHIYDRWGNRIFEKNGIPTNDPSFGWDGRHKDEKLLPGVYLYHIQYELNGESIQVFGSVSLVR